MLTHHSACMADFELLYDIGSYVSQCKVLVPCRSCRVVAGEANHHIKQTKFTCKVALRSEICMCYLWLVKNIWFLSMVNK